MKRFILISFILFFSCKPSKNLKILKNSVGAIAINQTDSIYGMQNWYVKNFPGINLDEVYTKLIKKRKGENIIIAVIDTSVDINHEDLNTCIWENSDEIANNNLDDDNNGYIDDIHGWNFMGNIYGENSIYENHEFVRVVRYYQNIFEDKTYDQITSDSLKRKFNEYTEAKEMLDKKVAQRLKYFESDSTYMVGLKKAIEKFESIIPRGEMTVEKLDSVGKVEKNLLEDIKTLKWAVKHNYSVDDAIEDVGTHRRYRGIYYNINYNEREVIKDDSDDIEDNLYGNSLVNNNIDKIGHGTSMVAIIASNRNNNIGIKGITNNVKIMPIVAACYGQAHDKDLALAIRYAVDNGAKIINMSIVKKFSTHKEWVFEAIKYAEKNDVLIVNAAGNDNENIDESKNFYPNDTDYYSDEISSNFLMVGGSSNQLNKNIKYRYSNYGKENVDLFAPADSIYTTTIMNKYKFVDGTSVAAPIVSGVAGLIRSYFPELKAQEVKQILMDSGAAYDVMVNISNNRKEEKLVPFSSLSKSGKILDAYNAFLMAEKISKNKNR